MPWLRISMMLVLGGAILGGAVIRDPERATLVGKLLMLAIILLFLIPNHRIYVMVAMVLACAMLAYVLFHWIKYEKLYYVQALAFCFLGLLSVGGLQYYNYVERPKGFHFLLVPLILTIISIILAVIICIYQRYTAANWLVCVVCVPFLILLMSWLTLSNLNYALDFSEPTETVCEITTKDVRTSSGRGATTHYEFTVQIDGNEVTLEVSEAHYDAFNVGDDITVSRYQGFFDDPYYILENQ